MGEISRRLVHASGAVVPGAFLLGVIEWIHLQILLALGCLVTAGLEWFRLRHGLDWRIYTHLTREYEAHTVAGYAYYVVSITVVALLFDPLIAVPAMLMLMFGDPLSGLMSSGGPTALKGWKSLLTMFVVSLAIGIPFTVELHASLVWGVTTAGVAALLAMLADGVTVTIRDRVLDDNLTIPIAGAVGILIGSQFLPPAI